MQENPELGAFRIHAALEQKRGGVEVSPARQRGLRQVRRPELFETVHVLPQPRLFGLKEVLGDGWLKVLRLEGYAPRSLRRSEALQRTLFPYYDAWG